MGSISTFGIIFGIVIFLVGALIALHGASIVFSGGLGAALGITVLASGMLLGGVGWLLIMVGCMMNDAEDRLDREKRQAGDQ